MPSGSRCSQPVRITYERFAKRSTRGRKPLGHPPARLWVKLHRIVFDLEIEGGDAFAVPHRHAPGLERKAPRVPRTGHRLLVDPALVQLRSGVRANIVDGVPLAVDVVDPDLKGT